MFCEIQALEDQLTRLAPSFESMRETAEQTLAPAQEISTMLQGMSELKLKMQRLEGRVAGFAIQVKEASHMETENNSEVELKYQGVAGRVEEVNGVMTTLWEMHHTLGEEVGTLRKDAETVSSDLKVLKSAVKRNRAAMETGLHLLSDNKADRSDLYKLSKKLKEEMNSGSSPAVIQTASIKKEWGAQLKWSDAAGPNEVKVKKEMLKWRFLKLTY